MSETAAIVSAGSPTRVDFSHILAGAAQAETDNGESENAVEGDLNNQESNSEQVDAKPQFKDEDLVEYLKSKGIDYSGNIEDVIAKLKPQGAEPTQDEIDRKNNAIEKRMLDKFIQGGGKVEDFASVKQLLNADIAEVSKSVLKKELTDAGFDEEETKAIIKQRYLQHDLESLVFDEDGEETKEEFEKRKAKLEKQVFYGAEILANRSLPIKQKAETVWNDLKREVELEDADLEREAKFSTQVDSHVQSLPKSITLSIGQIDGKDIEPIAYTVPEEVHQEVSALLKDRQKREEFFYDAEGNLNIQNIADIIVRNKILEKAARETYLKGGTAQVKIFEQMFPARKATDLGVGGSERQVNTKMGQPVSRGEAQKFQPTIKN